jgi:hypothetical protein
MTPTAPTSIWWRLSDVVPLAEHAMAVPAHRLTGAQVCAGDTVQPALVWTSDPTGDWLASNGVPVWYDHDGTDHQAAACTWYHTATGVRGSPGQPDPAAGFLPLTRRPPHPGRRAHQPTLIDLLRKGARTGCHWFVLDTDPRAAANGTRYRSATTATTPSPNTPGGSPPRSPARKSARRPTRRWSPTATPPPTATRSAAA